MNKITTTHRLRDRGQRWRGGGAGCACGNAQQQVAKFNGRPDAARAISAAALGRHFTATLGAVDANAGNNLRVETHFALAPPQFRQIDGKSIEPSRFACVMAIAPLLDAAGPAADEISRNPSAFARRLVQSEMRPCVRLIGMLDNPTPFADSIQSGGETTAIIALDLAFAGLLDPQRLPGPQLAPALARRVCHDRVTSSIQARVTSFVPWLNARQPEIAAVGFDIERRDRAGWGAGDGHLLGVHTRFQRAHGFGESGFCRDDWAEITGSEMAAFVVRMAVANQHKPDAFRTAIPFLERCYGFNAINRSVGQYCSRWIDIARQIPSFPDMRAHATAPFGARAALPCPPKLPTTNRSAIVVGAKRPRKESRWKNTPSGLATLQRLPWRLRWGLRGWSNWSRERTSSTPVRMAWIMSCSTFRITRSIWATLIALRHWRLLAEACVTASSIRIRRSSDALDRAVVNRFGTAGGDARIEDAALKQRTVRRPVVGKHLFGGYGAHFRTLLLGKHGVVSFLVDKAEIRGLAADDAGRAHAATRRRGLALFSSIASKASTNRMSGLAAVSLRETDACVIPSI